MNLHVSELWPYYSVAPNHLDHESDSPLSYYLDPERVTAGDKENLNCVICSGILWNPVSCSNGHNFCKVCIETWLLSKTTCPSCKVNWSQKRADPIIFKLLSKIKVTCTNSLNGCATHIPYDSLEKHEDSCLYNVITCGGCSFEILKKDWGQHETMCQEISFVCGECKTRIKRRNQVVHANECVKIRLDKLEKNNEMVMKENEMGMKENEELRKRLNKLEKNNEMVMKENEMVMKENEELRKRLNKLEKNNEELSEDPDTIKLHNEYHKYLITGMKCCPTCPDPVFRSNHGHPI